MSKDLLTTEELAKRWGVSEGTLKRWRSEDQGPPYIKLDGQRSVRYRITDIIRFEESNLVTPKKEKADAE